jgi:hypothetical protein
LSGVVLPRPQGQSADSWLHCCSYALYRTKQHLEFLELHKKRWNRLILLFFFFKLRAWSYPIWFNLLFWNRSWNKRSNNLKQALNLLILPPYILILWHTESKVHRFWSWLQHHFPLIYACPSLNMSMHPYVTSKEFPMTAPSPNKNVKFVKGQTRGSVSSFSIGSHF